MRQDIFEAQQSNTHAMQPLRLTIACLCARWCGSCRDYTEIFNALKQALPQHDWRWIDIEDESDLVDELDIENFPTLMIAQDKAVLFGGAVMPRLNDALRLIEALTLEWQESDANADAKALCPKITPGDEAGYAALALRLQQDL